jgi:Zn-dependent protease
MSWAPSYSSSWTPPRSARRITTSRTELLHLGVAYAVLTGCLTLVFSGTTFLGGGFSVPGLRGISPTFVVVAALAALTGFVAHEMAHKVAAQRLGYWAEFRASAYGLGLALFTSIAGFILAAPGATVVAGMSEADLPNWGRTSLAGPMTNLGFAAGFYLVAIGIYLAHSPYFVWALLIAFINAWFGTFNLFPFGVLDGAKVFRWSRAIWGGVLGLALVALALTGLALYVYVNPFLGF